MRKKQEIHLEALTAFVLANKEHRELSPDEKKVIDMSIALYKQHNNLEAYERSMKRLQAYLKERTLL